MASAGGSATGGGSAAGGTASAGGSAGPSCIGVPFCVHRFTQRTDYKAPDALVGGRLDDAAAIFSRFSAPIGSIWVSHGPTSAVSTGTASPYTVGTPPLDSVEGTPSDYVIVAESNLTIARVQHVVDGGVVRTFDMGTCGTGSFYASSVGRLGNRVVVGGYDESLCEVNLATGSRTLLQPETSSNNEFVNDVHITSTGEVYWATSDGYVGRVGAGRITGQLDPSGIIGIDGVAGGPIWVVSDQGYVTTIQADGGVGGQQDYSGLLGRAYSLEVTTDGVFIGAFGGIGHRTRFTDGGFQLFPLPLPSTTVRAYQVAGAPGAIHVSGDEGPISSPTDAWFFSLIPRTQ